MTKQLFSEFDPVSKEEWIAQATRDLKGKDFDQSLKSRLWDRIPLDPFYTLEDLSDDAAQISFHPEPEIPGMSPRIWDNLASIYPGDTNEYVLKVLQNGAEGLILHLSGFEDLDTLLKAVKPEFISLMLKPTGNPIAALRNFIAWLEASNVAPESLRGGLLWAPSDLVFDQNEGFDLALDILGEILEMTEPYHNFRALTLATSRYSESGANPIDSLVFGLGELMDWIDKGKFSPDVIFKNVLLEAAIGESHFGEIARLKAFRLAMISLAELYGPHYSPADFVLLGMTSQWSKSALDTNNNLIRQTYEAMAAILGGANLLWVQPFQEEDCCEMERRIARNVSSILKEEAYLDKVMDPGSGSFFLENLEKDILQEIQKGLQTLEQNGGWYAALKNGQIHRQVRASREKAQNAVLEGKALKIGANKYLAAKQLKNDETIEVFSEKSFQLNPTRATYLCELQNQVII